MRFKRKELAAHPFMQTALRNLRPLLESASRELQDFSRKGQVRNTVEVKLWEHEWYDDNVFRNASALISAIENLQQSRNFIAVFPQPRRFEKKGVSRHTWIEYHYAHYLITLVSILDVSLIVTNSVFRLGNRERDCRADLIMKNRWVAGTPVAVALNRITDLIKPYREGRNLHVHQGRIPKIAEAMKSDTLDKLGLFSFVQMCGRPVLEKRILELAYKGQTKEICSRLMMEKETIRDAVWNFFDTLAPIYDEKSKALHMKWRQIVESELERRKGKKD